MNTIETSFNLVKKRTAKVLFFVSIFFVVIVTFCWFGVALNNQFIEIPGLVLFLVINLITGNDDIGQLSIISLVVSGVAFLLARFLYKSSTQTTLNITMLGPSGVGKTSLLAAIYHQFAQITNLQIKSEDKTKVLLDNRLNELKSEVKKETIRCGGGVPPTAMIPPKFLFDIGLSPSYWKITFQDYPGEFIELAQQNIKKVESFLKESTAVLLAIDTPSLMERGGQWHDKINKPDLIKKLFTDAYQDIDSPRLVILAPVKCEKYVQNERDAKELLRSVKEKYENLLSLFRQGTLESKVAVVITPVQTVGSVIFSRIDIDTETNEPIFEFRKYAGDGSYSPKDCDQPLRYLFQFLHKNYPRDPLFTKNSKLQASVVDIANGCKRNTGGFEVVQGAGLLF